MPRSPSRTDAPAPAHPQMAPEHDAALEPQEQVLADRLHLLEHTSIDDESHARRLTARMRALGLDALADERLETRGCAMQRVALRHQPSSADSSSSSAAKIDSEKVGYGWIVSRRTPIGLCEQFLKLALKHPPGSRLVARHRPPLQI